MVTIALKSNIRKTSTLGWFNSQRNWQESYGKPRLNSGGVHTCLPTPKTGQRGQVETVWDASWFSATVPTQVPASIKYPLQTHLLHETAPPWGKGCHFQGEAHLKGTKAAQYQSNIWAEWEQSLLGLMGADPENSLGIWLQLEPPHPTPRLRLSATPAPFAPALLPTAARMLVLAWGIVYI